MAGEKYNRVGYIQSNRER